MNRRRFPSESVVEPFDAMRRCCSHGTPLPCLHACTATECRGYGKRRQAAALQILCAAALILAASHADAGWNSSIRMAPGSGVDIDLASPLTNPPPDGGIPVRVTIKNRSGAARVWTIRATGGSQMGNAGNELVATRTLRVENDATARLSVLLPLEPKISTAVVYQSVIVQVDGYGVEGNRIGVPTASYSSKKSTAAIGLGETLATPLWEPLKKELDGRGFDLAGTPVDTTLLGPDWRDLCGLDCLWLTEAEYERLDAAPRAAIQRWVERGGTLYLCAPTADETTQGYGTVRHIAWDGKAFTTAEAAEIVNGIRTLRDDAAANDAAAWPMARAVGGIPINAPFLIGFIGVFAVLVGPVNLFLLADATRRHRLFWTTPLISLGASLLLMLVIVGQDGFGGHGERVIVTLLCPDRREAVVVQEQVTRTGVLSARQFTVSEDMVLTPLRVGRLFGRSFAQSGRDYGGDWFASRSVQAQRAEAIVPSRAEVQIVSGGGDGAPPVVVSSIPATLREIHYLDRTDHGWRGDHLHPGERVTLRPEPSFDHARTGGSVLLEKLSDLARHQPGSFYAVADDAPFLGTLPSIRWQKQNAVYLGPVTK